MQARLFKPDRGSALLDVLAAVFLLSTTAFSASIITRQMKQQRVSMKRAETSQLVETLKRYVSTSAGSGLNSEDWNYLLPDTFGGIAVNCEPVGKEDSARLEIWRQRCSITHPDTAATESWDVWGSL